MTTLTVAETAALLREWDDILLLTHRSPDGDTIGSATALCRILRGLGKTAWLLKSEDAISLFQPYLEDTTAPEDFTPRRVVAVDVASEGLLPPNADSYWGRIDLAIDHHPSNTGFAEQSCVQGDKAACGEIIYAIAQELGVMDTAIAQALYLALMTDTGCFAYSNTTPHTHRVAAALMEYHFDAALLSKRHFRTKTLKRLKLESAILRDMELYQDGTVAVAPISLALLEEVGATEEDTDGIAAFIGEIEGVRHGITVKEKRPGLCKVSLRTDAERLNASAVCSRLGGGGHAAAAGCAFYGTVRETIDAVMAAIQAQQGS